jgi:hypothetical protein
LTLVYNCFLGLPVLFFDTWYFWLAKQSCICLGFNYLTSSTHKATLRSCDRAMDQHARVHSFIAKEQQWSCVLHFTLSSMS